MSVDVPPPTVVIPPNADYIDLYTDNFAVPSASTTYVCLYYPLPEEMTNTSWHLITQEETFGGSFVHHVLLFGCEGTVPSYPTPIPCGMAPAECQEPIISLGMPDGSGFVLGLNGYKSLVLQFHYNNPMERSDLVDHKSGQRIWYIPRPTTGAVDVGILTVGAASIAIGEHMSQYVAAGLCTLNSSLVPESGLKVYYNGWHMHTLGRAINTTLIRGGKELGYLGHQPYYHFNFQGTFGFPFPDPAGNAKFTLYGGDSLLTRCTYNASLQATKTFFGEATTDEMCFNFLMYSPRIPELSPCIASFGTLACALDKCGSDVSACLAETGCASILNSLRSVSSGLNNFNTSEPLFQSLMYCYMNNCTVDMPAYTPLPTLCAEKSSSSSILQLSSLTLVLMTLFHWVKYLL